MRGLDGLHIVSADIVEVAPAYDTNAELTTMAAADVSVFPINFTRPRATIAVALIFPNELMVDQVLFEVLSVMAKTPLGKVAN